MEGYRLQLCDSTVSYVFSLYMLPNRAVVEDQTGLGAHFISTPWFVKTQTQMVVHLIWLRLLALRLIQMKFMAVSVFLLRQISLGEESSLRE